MASLRLKGCIAGALLISGCGTARTVMPPTAGRATSAGRSVPVNQLLVAADGRLLATAPTGLFQVSSRGRLVRLSDERRRLEGIAQGPRGVLLVSGHRAPTDDLPPQLGLLGSTDEGRSWRSQSLAGVADLHAIRVAGRTIYGLDGTMLTLLASDDLGRTWRVRTTRALDDIAVDPADPHRLIAATEDGLIRSSDGGRRWRSVTRRLTGRLSWPVGGHLTVATAGGSLVELGAGGRPIRRGRFGGAAIALASSPSGRTVYVAREDGVLLVSRDRGRTWSDLARP